MRGLKDNCTSCGSENVEGETRVVGYFSKINNWNKSKKLGELPARQRGAYAVEAGGSAFDLPAPVAEETAPVANPQYVEA